MQTINYLLLLINNTLIKMVDLYLNYREVDLNNGGSCGTSFTYSKVVCEGLYIN